MLTAQTSCAGRLNGRRADLTRVREEQRTHHAALMAIQQTQNAHSTLLNQVLEDVATLRLRFDRIERRLDLVDTGS